MRIENWPFIATENRVDTGSLLSQLLTGDLIKALVLEISASEAVLRLSDGSVLKAATGDDVEIKAGQTITLVVKSKTDTLIELETVKNSSSNTASIQPKLSKILEALNIKPDDTSLKVAAEFLKYGIMPDADEIMKAVELIGDSGSMDAEKAVYIISKNINMSKTDAATLASFLDGDLKLGKILDELLRALGENTGQKQSPTQSNMPAATSSGKLAHESAQSLSALQKQEALSAAMHTPAHEATDAHAPTETSVSALVAGTDTSASETSPESINKAASEPANDATLAFSDTDIDEMPGDKGSAEKATSGKEYDDKVSELKSSISKLFIKINKELSSKDLDIPKAMEKVDELLKNADSLLKSPEQHQEHDGALKAATAAGDTIRLLDTLNAGNVYYYQLPVNMAGSKSTAELYVMKRRKGGRKIDPQDSVLFLSLDTVSLGRIEVLTELKGNGISISLRTKSKEVNDFIKANIKSLYSGLQECGRKLVSVRYSIIGEPSDLCAQGKILLETVKAKHARVDLRI